MLRERKYLNFMFAASLLLANYIMAGTHELKAISLAQQKSESSSAILFSEDSFLAPAHWQHKDYNDDLILGVSSKKAFDQYTELTHGEEIIVAVIDSGIDINHQDLVGKIWVNSKEIPNNNYDDDHNGYIDDVTGWNFLGNSKGHGQFEQQEDGSIAKFIPGEANYQLKADTLSFIRRLRFLNSIPANQLTVAQTKEIKSLNHSMTTKRKRAEKLFKEYQLDELIFIESITELTSRGLTKENLSLELLHHIDEDLEHNEEKAFFRLKEFLTRGIDLAYISAQKEMYKIQYEFHYNMDSNARFDIVGDNPHQFIERGYGNNDVIGPNPTHGTHVAGIIAANRDNDFGIKGLASSVKIMPLRTIPDGDERDKDVANAIYYAVDNGANIINMSFGKYFSGHIKEVQEALQYAKEHNVLIVQAAGNDYLNIDKRPNFPSPFIEGEKLDNYITVGSTTPHPDETLMSPFSNFGKISVDLLAPGSFIYSTIPGNKFASMSGTSMAAPMVSGIAATLLSQNSELSSSELKNVLIQGRTKLDNHLIRKPGLIDATLADIVKYPGIVNLYNSYQQLVEHHKYLD